MFALMLTAAAVLWDGTVRAEARAGPPAKAQSPSSAAILADLGLLAAESGTTLNVRLAPSASFSDSSLFFARATAALGLPAGPGNLLSVRQILGYGSIDFAPISANAQQLSTPGTLSLQPGQPPPLRRFVLVEESRSAVDADFRLSERFHFGGGAEWFAYGGADSQAREVLPIARGPSARMTSEWAASRLQTIGALLSWNRAVFSTGTRAEVYALTASLRSTLDRQQIVTIAAGFNIGSFANPGHPTTTTPYPSGGLEYRLVSGRLSATLGATIESVADQLSGTLAHRLGTRTDLTWSEARFLLRSASSGSVLLADTGSTFQQAGDVYAQSELVGVAPLRTNPRIGLGTGVRFAYTTRPFAGTPHSVWSVFLTCSVSVPAR